MLRFAVIAAAAVGVALSACKENTPPPAQHDEELSSARQVAPQGASQADPEAEASPAAPPPSLDLSYSEEEVEVRDLSEDELSRHQVDDWFESQGDGEKKLSVKPKIRIKEDATLEQTMGDYRDSLDGAEMGIEYKTR